MTNALRSLLVCLAACAPTWHRAARVTEALAVGSLACDGGSTRQYLAESQWVETNPILGEHPSSAALWLYLGAIAGGVIGLNRLVPDKLALALNVAMIGIEVQSIAINAGVGASMCGVGEGGPWQPLPTTRTK